MRDHFLPGTANFEKLFQDVITKTRDTVDSSYLLLTPATLHTPRVSACVETGPNIAQWAKSGVFVQSVYYQIWNWVLKCVQGCCRVCPWVLQNVCMVTELSNIFSNFSKIFFGAKKYFKQKVATQAKSQRGLKIIHRLVQSLWSLIQSYLVVPGGAGATKSSAQDGFWPDIALWTLWPTVHCIAAFICMLIWSI